jgi:uncharacterized membrane protein YvlD (DUF360 family)
MATSDTSIHRNDSLAYRHLRPLSLWIISCFFGYVTAHLVAILFDPGFLGIVTTQKPILKLVTITPPLLDQPLPHFVIDAAIPVLSLLESLPSWFQSLTF